MKAVFDREWTADDVIAAQETSLVRVELLDGVVVMSPLSSVRHQHVCVSLSAVLARAAVDGRNDVVVFRHSNVRRGDRDLLRPDIAVVGTAAAESGVEGDHTAFAPEDVVLAVEVLSAGHQGVDRVDKLAKYAQWAIESYWVVDPKQSTIETFTLSGTEYVASGTAEPGAVVTLPAFTPITLDPGALLRVG
ncbi:Uma2 family endonuclease [Streptomyces sp. SID3343]|uniref:Uma2 family endonuclease n=1 Tax=Streptomyces sp. SID3343 TaxID=2690260 RepID=UPI00136A245E|nr:hypothetical protein [Streptomyces sp. SID3343]